MRFWDDLPVGVPGRTPNAGGRRTFASEARSRAISLVSARLHWKGLQVLENHFGEEVAARYDETSGPMFDPEVLGKTVDLLAELAGDGAALELAIGTGRVALPLAARGVPVTGIDLSPPMVEQLRAKPGGDAIDVTIGDMTTTRVDGTFGLVYLV